MEPLLSDLAGKIRRQAGLCLGLAAAGRTPAEVHALTDPADPSFQVRYELYPSSAVGSAPWVVLLPPTGGINPLDRRYARQLQERGAHVFLVQEWTDAFIEADDLDVHEKGLKSSLRAFDLLRVRAGGARLRLFGTSLGGLYSAAIASHRHEGVEKMALVVTGGPLSRVVARSKLGSLKDLKERRRRVLGFSDDDAYERLLREKIHHDFVGTLGYGLAPEKILMVIAGEDTAVPTDTQLALWRELGEPRHLDVAGGHLRTILQSYLWYSAELTAFVAGDG